jgi:STE24 endopeptidase
VSSPTPPAQGQSAETGGDEGRGRVGLTVVSIATLLVGSGGLVALLLVWVPWQPAGPLTAPPASAFFTAQELDRARSLATALRWLRIGALATTLLVAGAFGLTRLRGLLSRVPGWWWWRTLVVVIAFQLTGWVLTLPFALLIQRELRRQGLSTQGWWGALVDLGLQEVVSVLTVAIAALVVVAAIRRWPVAWPAAAGVSLAALVMLGSFVYPVLVEPLFDHVTPLPAGHLRNQVMALARTEGVHLDDVLVVNASARTTTLNAYVSGFGATRRVVLYDNLLSQPRQEVLAVVAHELGHAKRNDVWWGSLIGACGVMMGVGVLGLYAARRRVARADSPGLVAPMLAAATVLMIVALPVENAVSRAIEAKADLSSLRATQNPAAFVRLQVDLALSSHADPSPPGWAQWIWGTHPSTMLRIAMGEAFQPAARGE